MPPLCVGGELPPTTSEQSCGSAGGGWSMATNHPLAAGWAAKRTSEGTKGGARAGGGASAGRGRPGEGEAGIGAGTAAAGTLEAAGREAEAIRLEYHWTSSGSQPGCHDKRHNAQETLVIWVRI